MTKILFHTNENGIQHAADFLNALVASNNKKETTFILRALELLGEYPHFPIGKDGPMLLGEILSEEYKMKANHELVKRLSPYTVPGIYELRIEFNQSSVRMFYFPVKDSLNAQFYVFTEAYEFTAEQMQKGLKNKITEQARQRAYNIAIKYKVNPDSYIRKSGGYK